MKSKPSAGKGDTKNRKVKPQTYVSDQQWIPYVIFSGIALLFILIRIRLLQFPLERDEGEYAYFGQLILNGIQPFQMAYNLKFPGIYYMYALIMGVFGQTAAGIHLGLLVINLGSLVLLFFIARRLFNDFVACAASAIFAVLTVSPSFLGQAAHATHFMTLFMLTGTLMLIIALERSKWYYYLLSGLFMGLSFTIKQSGIFFPLFGGIVILIYPWVNHSGNFKRLLKPLILYGSGVAIPILVIFLVMAVAGVFDRFWFWTMTYPSVYGSRVPIGDIPAILDLTFFRMLNVFTLLWILSALGIPALFFYPGKKWSRIFLGLFLLFSLLPAIPGFYFRAHYFVPLIPAIGLSGSLALDLVNKRLDGRVSWIRWVTAILLIILILPGIQGKKDYYYNTPLKKLSARQYAGNPFLESIPVADYIRSHSSDQDTILVFGSEPQIYFLADRRSATGYIYMYDLVFDHPYVKQMQQELMEEVTRSKPRFIVMTNISYSWLSQGNVGDSLFRWFNSYIIDNRYETVGIAELHTPGPTVYIWDEAVKSHQKQSDTFIVLFRRGEE